MPKLDSLKQINLYASGIDIGSSEIYVAVAEEHDGESVRKFATFTHDLYQIAYWLQFCNIKTVAMESTGIYWIPLYEILVEKGIEVYLVNARDVKNVSGRKTDILDCQWLQQLHTYGLLRGSFRPEKDICELRDLIRHRDNLIRHRASHIQHMQKALHMMNIQLDNVISDITGVTGMKIVRAILEGERNTEVLASYRNPHCKNPEKVIEESLKGTYKKEYLFQLRQALNLYDYYTKLIKECDIEIEKIYAQFPIKVDLQEKPLQPQKSARVLPRKNEPDFNLRTYLYQMCGVDLTMVDGLNVLTVQTVISEIGIDMRKWKTVKHFTSWLGLCPYNDISGGKILNTKTKKTKNRANTALRQAAQSLHHSNSAMGAYYRRMRARLGAPKAITATAHKLARIIYYMLKYNVEFIDLGANYYEQKYKDREIKNLKRKAAKLGLQVVEAAA
ncbi:MAG: IS110 family transposase [Gammaproteobacteria bacterium]|nr:IS110 family transposase [Gammaproteobacteria bacterium]